MLRVLDYGLCVFHVVFSDIQEFAHKLLCGQPRGACVAGQCLWDDSLEAGSGRVSRFRHDLRKPGFRRLRPSLRGKGSRVESADALAPTLEAAFSGGGVHLVTVPVDYSENMRVLVEELRAHATKK
jgi:hypothetical protein